MEAGRRFLASALKMSAVQVQRRWESPQVEHSYWVPSTDIEGSVPTALKGTIFRSSLVLNKFNGTQSEQRMDGAGMICALTFVDGKVHFRNRAWKYQQTGTGSKKGAKEIPAFYDPSDTGVVFWGGKLLSFDGTYPPLSIDPVTLETLGPEKLDGTLQKSALASHVKFDPVHDCLVTMSLFPEIPGVQPPILQMNEYDSEWKLRRRKVVKVPGLNYAHDFILLTNYYIVHKSPFFKISENSPQAVPLDGSIQYHPDLPSQFVIIPRDTTIFPRDNRTFDWRLVDADPLHIFHFGTAEQTDGAIRFNAVTHGKDFNTKSKRELRTDSMIQPGTLQEFKIDLSNFVCTTYVVSRASCEFPESLWYRHGFPCRYTYLMATAEPDATGSPYTNIIKYDALRRSAVPWRSHGVVSGSCFVPRSWAPSEDPGSLGSLIRDEDDGWVVAQVYVPEDHRTDFVILDARDMDGKPVATINLRHHVLYGSHGTFTPNVFVQPPSPVGANL
ncbi:carotenoid oxygenase [Cladochytrium replicatum]|nr:carotenoid oxygenase [Cladochytrium replicatum]